jgi:hypothetical protein
MNTKVSLGSMGPRLVAAFVFLFSWSLTTHGKYSVSGDEPHYLMIAESIRADGDLDLANNYAQNDGRLFGHENLPIELHALRARNGELRSVHAVGIALAVLPLYYIAHTIADHIPQNQLQRFRMSQGLFVYSIIGLGLMTLTACGIALLASGLSNIVSERSAVVIATAIGMSPPVVSHSFLVFPEVAALFITCCVAWLAIKKSESHDVRRLGWMLLAIGLLPWFHQKYLVYTPGLLFVLARWRRELFVGPHSRLLLWSLIFAIPQLAAVAWLYEEWGSFGGALTIGALTQQRIPLTVDAFATGALGLLFDRQAGIAAFTPLFWVVPIAFVLTLRRTWDLLIPFALVYVPAAAFVIGWWAGFSPAARYLVPTVPLLVIPVAIAVRHAFVRNIATVLLAAQMIVNAIVWQKPRWLWPGTDSNQMLDALGPVGQIYAPLVPPIKNGLTAQAVVPVLFVIVLASLALFVVRGEKSGRESIGC